MLKRTLTAGLLTAFALAGCNGPIAAQQDGIEVYPKVTVTSYWLSANIVVQPPVVTPMANGAKQVTLVIRAKTDFDLTVDCQCTFLDKNGIAVEPTTTQGIRIPRKGVNQVQFTSMGPVDDFRIALRRAK